MKNWRCFRQAADRAIQLAITPRFVRVGTITSRLFNRQCGGARTEVPKTQTSRTILMSQPGVTSFPLKHALFFTASLKNSGVDKIQARTITHSIFNLIRQRDPLYTMAFSDRMCHLLDLPALPVTYKQRKYSRGVMDDKGGDIFVHLKSNDRGELQADAIRMLSLIPDVALAEFEDIYGFVFDGRDLSGFIDGINNPSTVEDRVEFGVDPETNDSYVITQKWIHDMGMITSEKVSEMEQLVGRTRQTGEELPAKREDSHVARMKGGSAYKQPPKYRIVRQSMPYGSLSKEAGLFFIAYSKSLEAFEFMLDRMVEEGQEDGVLSFSRACTGAYWYAPNLLALEAIKP